MSKERHIKVNSENEAEKEKYDIHFGGLTISGLSGTGKTRLAEDLAQELKINNFIMTGQIFRDFIEKESGEQTVGFQDRELTLDEKLDNYQRQLLNEATPKNPLILEGRLAGFLASQMRKDAQDQNLETPNTVTVLLTAPSNTRYARILSREKPKDPSLTIGKIGKETKKREKGDRKQWEVIHSDLKGIDPFNPSNRTTNGDPMYDIVINTKNKNVEEVLNELLFKLEDKEYIKKIESESQTVNFPQSQIIFRQ